MGFQAANSFQGGEKYFQDGEKHHNLRTKVFNCSKRMSEILFKTAIHCISYKCNIWKSAMFYYVAMFYLSMNCECK